jgi:hypothetical protein
LLTALLLLLLPPTCLQQEMTGPQAGLDEAQPYEILKRQRAAQQRLAEELEEAQQRRASRPRRKVGVGARGLSKEGRRKGLPLLLQSAGVGVLQEQ